MGRNKGKQPARGKQQFEKDKDSENVNEELVQPPAQHSKDIENVDQDKGVSGGVDEDRWAEEDVVNMGVMVWGHTLYLPGSVIRE